MILPDKMIELPLSLIGIGASILNELKPSCSMGALWQRVQKKNEHVKAWNKFIFALDFLYALNLIEFKDDKIYKLQMIKKSKCNKCQDWSSFINKCHINFERFICDSDGKVSRRLASITKHVVSITPVSVNDICICSTCHHHGYCIYPQHLTNVTECCNWIKDT